MADEQKNYDESLPKTFKLYHPNENAKLDEIVGNTELAEKLLNGLLTLLYHDDSCGENAFLIYGLPRTGKSFTVDAALNHASYLAREHGKQLTMVDLSQIKSMYKDRSAQLVEHFFRMEQNSPGVFVNVIDEFDSLIADANKYGETRKIVEVFKRMLEDEKSKGKIMTIAITSYAGLEEIDPAIKQRFQGSITDLN